MDTIIIVIIISLLSGCTIRNPDVNDAAYLNLNELAECFDMISVDDLNWNNWNEYFDISFSNTPLNNADGNPTGQLYSEITLTCMDRYWPDTDFNGTVFISGSVFYSYVEKDSQQIINEDGANGYPSMSLLDQEIIIESDFSKNGYETLWDFQNESDDYSYNYGNNTFKAFQNVDYVEINSVSFANTGGKLIKCILDDNTLEKDEVGSFIKVKDGDQYYKFYMDGSVLSSADGSIYQILLEKNSKLRTSLSTMTGSIIQVFSKKEFKDLIQ